MQTVGVFARLHTPRQSLQCSLLRLRIGRQVNPAIGQLIKAMPSDSKVTLFSALSRKAVQANPGTMIFQNKSIDGFWLGPYISKQGIMKTMKFWKRAQRQIPTHLKSEIRKIYPLQEVKEAIYDYRNQMTGGKILLSMSH